MDLSSLLWLNLNLRSDIGVWKKMFSHNCDEREEVMVFEKSLHIQQLIESRELLMAVNA
jgi:hypothetical protein